MNPEEIRALRRADPFHPFNLTLRDGRKLPVDEPNSLMMSPDGRLLVFLTLSGWFEQLPAEHVTGVDFKVNVVDVRRLRQVGSVRTA